jgi:8-oxo-dGTP diphosphatase
MIKGQDYIAVGVGAAIVRDGKLLIQKRGQKVRNEIGKWEIPGGGIEYGESHKDALIREVKEETGVEIEVLELLNIADHINPSIKQHWIAAIYLCRIVSGEPRIMEPEKCEELGWFTLEEAKQLDLAPITREDIEILIKKFPNGLPQEL